MSETRQHLKSGLVLNRTIRRVFGCFLALTVVSGVTGMALMLPVSGSPGTYTLLLTFLAPFLKFFVMVPLLAWAIALYPPVTVLDDGLDVGGRFVPFCDVEKVEQTSAQSLKVTYRYHGVTMMTRVATTLLCSLDLAKTAHELRAQAGLGAAATQPAA